ncbi:MAG: hypothetical protein JSU63_17905 [Phycisphaerales bacterium]|nr:MAG: hypothetical protein JSU63_17905 [Phycisphaerales bacterium]
MQLFGSVSRKPCDYQWKGATGSNLRRPQIVRVFIDSADQALEVAQQWLDQEEDQTPIPMPQPQVL